MLLLICSNSVHFDVYVSYHNLCTTIAQVNKILLQIPQRCHYTLFVQLFLWPAILLFNLYLATITASAFSAMIRQTAVAPFTNMV